MTKKKVLVSGCNGHMGQILCRLIDESMNFKVQYALDKIPWEFPNYCVCTSLEEVEDMEDNPDIIIDFSAPEATMQLLDFAKKFSIPIVIATTGFTDEQSKAITEASRSIPIFQSANMSLDIMLLKNILQMIASKLKDCDIEISETHHNRKKDSPSGTAKLLANAINESLGNTKEIVYGRKGKRGPDEIGISSVRGGNIVGEHSVFFFGEYDTLEIKHTAYSRDLFAQGALKAAEFLLEKEEPGLYSMDDLITL